MMLTTLTFSFPCFANEPELFTGVRRPQPAFLRVPDEAFALVGSMNVEVGEELEPNFALASSVRPSAGPLVSGVHPKGPVLILIVLSGHIKVEVS
jgi:hypothetical protein